MPGDDENTRRWIVEPPPATGEVSLYLACGSGVVLSDEQEVALTKLLESLERSDPEVVGHETPCDNKVSFCNPLECGTVKCALLGCKLKSGIAAVAPGPGSWAIMGSFGTLD